MEQFDSNVELGHTADDILGLKFSFPYGIRGDMWESLIVLKLRIGDPRSTWDVTIFSLGLPMPVWTGSRILKSSPLLFQQVETALTYALDPKEL